MPNQPWSEAEVQATVEDYFEMFRCEMTNQPYNKAEHNRHLRERLNNRTKASVELKHQNISAVLVQMGLPFLPGYKPKKNFQTLLREEVERHVAANPDLHQQMQVWARRDPDVPPAISVLVVAALGLALAS